MTNVRSFGNQYQCVDCGAIWDVGDREPHVCVPARDVIPHAREVKNSASGEMKRVKVAVNNMLREGKTSCKITGDLSQSMKDHLNSRGYGTRLLGFDPLSVALTQVYVK